MWIKVFFVRNTRVIPVIEFKKHVASASIFGIIISKFRHKKKPCLVILFEIDKSSKISFYYTILLFNLIVCLWIKGGGKSLLDAKEKT